MRIRRGLRLGAVIASVSLIAACGGGDDEEADDAPAAADEGEDDAVANEDGDEGGDAADEGDAEGDDEGDDDVITVDDIDDMPEECREAFADYLHAIEPIVSDIDWENATMADFESLGTELEAEMSGMDAEMEANCAQFDLSGDADFEQMVEFARDEAPGTVGYFEFLAEMMADASAIADANNIGSSDPAAIPADLPQDCEGLMAWVEDLAAEKEKMSNLTMEELMEASAAMSAISTTCTIGETNEFFSREDITTFMGS